jgi:hypothetical protein
MMPDKRKTVVSKNRNFPLRDLPYSKQLECRAMGAYFRMGGTDQPDSNCFGHFMLDRHPDAERSDFLEYIRLGNAGGTLAVYRSTPRGELKRLRRWHSSIDDGTARTYASFAQWFDEQKKRSRSHAAADLDLSATLAELSAAI